VWCGYACPQTVFLEGLYRRVERFIEGESRVRLRRNRGPWNFDKLWRKTLKHGIFLALSLLVAHVFVSYFVSLPRLFEMVRTRPSEHPEAFAWMAAITGLTYFNFSWFREQLCLVVCPYGRLQSALLDDDTFLVVYDEARGEPRGKAKDANAGACVDCGRCVAVCPTAIDIRNGTQLECIGCAACIDACDDIMDKLGREPGLVRYDSLAGLHKKPRRLLRPRILFYGVLGFVGLTVAISAARGRQSFEANMLRQRGAPYVVDGNQVDGLVVRNALELHLENKRSDVDTLHLAPNGPDAMRFIVPKLELELESLSGTHLPFFAEIPKSEFRPGLTIRVTITSDSGESKLLEAPFLGPQSGGTP
jgi:cytochrome c oxidase accessory protein FixG